MMRENLRGGGYPSKAISALGNWYGHMNTSRRYRPLMPMLLITATIIGCLPINALTPTTAYASTMTAATDTYQIYDTRERTEQVSVNKVWDDGLTNDARKLYSSSSYPYENYLSMTIQTGVPQTAVRTYAIAYDANGGNFGTDSNGNTITTNTITYNAKNAPTNGTYATPERTDGYTFLGWSTNKNATGPDTSIILTNTVTDKWMNKRTDGSSTTLYAVWKDLRINYAVMAYGISVDKDANGNTMGITFGPALGYPEFSHYNNWTDDSTSTQTFTKSHSVSGDATVMSESATACTDTSHSVITGTDAGTDAVGNAYRCLHYDNWATIIYWNEHDPHVYDKCIPNHCSKTVMIAPSAGTIGNWIFSTSMNDSNRGLVGDGQSYIMRLIWDHGWDGVDITQAGQGYAASLVRAVLVGADSHTKLDDNYASVDALTRYTSGSSVLSCFPKVLRNAMGTKSLSGVSAASSGDEMPYDVVSNDGVADKLWLFSYGEMTDAVYPSVGFRSDGYFDAKRSSKNGWWLRSPYYSGMAHIVYNDGSLDLHGVSNGAAVAPGFTLT